MSDFILALDQGTTSSRTLLFDRAGEIVAASSQEFGQIFPRSGWVEHDPEEIWESQGATVRRVLAESGADPSRIAGIGITNQRETTVIWERSTGRPIANAIVWQDRRTSGFCDEIKKDSERAGLIRQRTGLVVDAYFSASKIRWLLDRVPRARERAEAGELAFGTIDSWLIWKLTGGRLHITDPSNACRTMLCRIDRAEWDDELLDLFGVPQALLPEIRDSSEVYGETDPDWFGRSLPIAGIAGDQQAALFGQACHSPGMTKNTYGTGCFLVMHTGKEPITSHHQLLTSIAWQIDGQREYALEGSIFAAGAVVQWLRDQLGIIETADEIESLAASTPDSGGVCLVPAFTGLGAPHWDPDARGAIVGLTRGSGRAHLARAALESIALQTSDILEAMRADAGIEGGELRVDGGASRNDLLMQIQADLAGMTVARSSTSETTSLGAALLAGLATGFWKDRAETAGVWKAGKRFLPANPPGLAGLREGWKRAVRQTRGLPTS